MPWAARSSARGAKWPSPCRLPVKPWHSTTSGSSSPRADLAGSWMVAGILPRVPGISMFFGLVLGCNSVTAATMHSAMAAKQASRIQGARVCLACFIWVPLFCFFQVYCTIIKTYSGWFVNCFLFKSSHIKNAKKATRASAFVVDTLAALLFIHLWYAIQHTHTDAGSLKGYLRSFLSVFLQSPKRQAVQRGFLALSGCKVQEVLPCPPSHSADKPAGQCYRDKEIQFFPHL